MGWSRTRLRIVNLRGSRTPTRSQKRVYNHQKFPPSSLSPSTHQPNIHQSTSLTTAHHGQLLVPLPRCHSGRPGRGRPWRAPRHEQASDADEQRDGHEQRLLLLVLDRRRLGCVLHPRGRRSVQLEVVQQQGQLGRWQGVEHWHFQVLELRRCTRGGESLLTVTQEHLLHGLVQPQRKLVPGRVRLD